MIDDTLLTAEDKMDKAVSVAKEDFASIRTGRANAGMFSKLLVDYYGAPTPLQQLASIAIPEARTVIISPFDRGAMKAIEKAIRDSDLGVNPTDDGAVIRINLPELTAERRKEYVKLARTRAEEARVAIRSVRRHAKDSLSKAKDEGEEGEDDVKRAEKELDSLTHAHVEQIDDLLAHKERELTEL